MIKIIIQTGIILTLTGCLGPGYKWINPEFTVEQMEDQFILDKGACMGEANTSYPDPYPVQDPEEAYYECMDYYREQETYVVITEEGRKVYRAVRDNPYLCRPSRQARDDYRAYEYELMQQKNNRAKYVNSCLAIKGWQQIPVE
jgi:hypothetical protein